MGKTELTLIPQKEQLEIMQDKMKELAETIEKVNSLIGELASLELKFDVKH